ncbi:tetratricopeptide repeat-containing protein, partial [Pseudomonas sp. FW215-L1]
SYCIDEAIEELSNLVAVYEQTRGKYHLETSVVRSKYAYFLRQAQDMDQAYEEYAIVAEGFRYVNGELHPDTLFVRQQFVECALELGEY